MLTTPLLIAGGTIAGILAIGWVFSGAPRDTCPGCGRETFHVDYDHEWDWASCRNCGTYRSDGVITFGMRATKRTSTKKGTKPVKLRTFLWNLFVLMLVGFFVKKRIRLVLRYLRALMAKYEETV
jgi:hypothetical protein